MYFEKDYKKCEEELTREYLDSIFRLFNLIHWKGASQVLCKHRRAMKIEQKIFVGVAACPPHH